MTAVKHYILTRYNVATPGRWEDIRLRPNWLEKRYELFVDYCLPGIAAQTRKDFEWILFFDTQTPKEYLERMENLQKVFPFRIQTTDLFEMKDLCGHFMKEQGDGEWLLTTRLDSDDILSHDFVERLRNVAKPGIHQNINFPNGFILSVKNGKLSLYKERDLSGPYASLMEPYSTHIQTIWGRHHRRIDEMAPIIQEGEKPAWLQVIHDDNISNHVRGVRVPLASQFDNFPILRTLSQNQNETEKEVLLENVMITPWRHMKESARSIIKKAIGRR